MTRTVVLNVVGLTSRLIGEHTPNLRLFRDAGATVTVEPAFPAVTCTAQSDYLTGTRADRHGIVGNGWYHREQAEVQFWKQSNRLVHGEKLWETLRRRDPRFTCAKLFWWYNMYSSADWSITPRPIYRADGRKVFDVYGAPTEFRTEVKQALGEFPFPGFWGPAAGVDTPQGKADSATRWIAGAAKWVEKQHTPTLSLVYLPHLDYNLQRHGPLARAAAPKGNGTGAAALEGGLNPAIRADLYAIDAILGDLLDFYEDRGVQVIMLSEYGIVNVDTPVQLNRRQRRRGWLKVKDELGLEILDAGASRAFAVADHQVAHIYVSDPALLNEVRAEIASDPGVAEVLGPEEKRARGIAHERAGDLIAVAREHAWFTYYYWLEDDRAPDFARCVDIHRKPGYDPVELFTDPRRSAVATRLKIGWRLLQKTLGFRMLMDVVPLDATLVGGSHGARPADRADWPLLIGPPGVSLPRDMKSTDVHAALMRSVLAGNAA